MLKATIICFFMFSPVSARRKLQKIQTQSVDYRFLCVFFSLRAPKAEGIEAHKAIINLLMFSPRFARRKLKKSNAYRGRPVPAAGSPPPASRPLLARRPPPSAVH